MNAACPHRAVIVEDERLARRDLATQLAAFPAVEIVGEAATAAEAQSVLARLKPDLVFLDIQLPDASGFELLARLPATPRIIFVTAYERYALRAFKVNALDYLLKPVETPALAEALRRLDATRDQAPPDSRSAPPFSLADHCHVAVGNFRGFLAIRTLRRIVADGNYTVVHTTDGRRFELKQSLNTWERRLPAGAFVRINRNEIVQVALIARLMPAVTDGYRVELTGESEPLHVSRRALAALRERFSG